PKHIRADHDSRSCRFAAQRCGAGLRRNQLRKSIELRQKAAELLEQSQRTVDTVMSQKRSPNAEEQRTLDNVVMQAGLLEAQIKVAERDEDAALRSMGGTPRRYGSAIGLQLEVR